MAGFPWGREDNGARLLVWGCPTPVPLHRLPCALPVLPRTRDGDWEVWCWLYCLGTFYTLGSRRRQNFSVCLGQGLLDDVGSRER